VACKNGHTEIVKLLLSHPKIDPSYGELVGMTELGTQSPLYFACEQNNKEMIKSLLSHPDLDPNYGGCTNFEANGKALPSPLRRMCETLNVEVVEMLLSHPQIDPNECVSSVQISFCATWNVKCSLMRRLPCNT